MKEFSKGILSQMSGIFFSFTLDSNKQRSTSWRTALQIFDIDFLSSIELLSLAEALESNPRSTGKFNGFLSPQSNTSENWITTPSIGIADNLGSRSSGLTYWFDARHTGKGRLQK
jgi:hypothetical protein